MIGVRQASPEDVDRLAPLFDAYRQFYERPADLALAHEFLAQRLTRGESTIFVQEDGELLGFVQLYPLFSSTALVPGRLWLLNDLFVVPAARGRGVGRQLMARARRLAEEPVPGASSSPRRAPTLAPRPCTNRSAIAGTMISSATSCRSEMPPDRAGYSRHSTRHRGGAAPGVGEPRDLRR